MFNGYPYMSRHYVYFLFVFMKKKKSCLTHLRDLEKMCSLAGFNIASLFVGGGNYHLIQEAFDRLATKSITAQQSPIILMNAHFIQMFRKPWLFLHPI